MRKTLSTNLAILVLVSALPAARAAAPIAKFDMRVGPPTEHHNLGNYGMSNVGDTASKDRSGSMLKSLTCRCWLMELAMLQLLPPGLGTPAHC